MGASTARHVKSMGASTARHVKSMGASMAGVLSLEFILYSQDLALAKSSWIYRSRRVNSKSLC